VIRQEDANPEGTVSNQKASPKIGDQQNVIDPWWASK
jgi:hypothetical protein